MSPSHTSEFFKSRNQQRYNLRQNSQSVGPMVHSILHGTESLAYLALKIWDMTLQALQLENGN